MVSQEEADYDCINERDSSGVWQEDDSESEDCRTEKRAKNCAIAATPVADGPGCDTAQLAITNE